jgi:hypothetical protein
MAMQKSSTTSPLGSEVEQRLVRLGVAAGGAAIVMYVTRTFLPLPGVVKTVFFVLFGPSLVVAFLGFYPFLCKPRPTVSAVLGTVFGIIAGATNMMFAVIQVNNLDYIGRYMRAADSPEARQMWQSILNGVFTVQNGLNFVMDFFLDVAALLFAMAMWKHPKFGKTFSLLAVLLVGPHFLMKAVSFPQPPAEAGLFDAGPLVGVWFTLVTIQIVRHLSWMEDQEGGAA